MKPAIKKEELGPDNEWGTPELTNKYKSETPGQTPKKEATNDAVRNVVKQNAHLYRDNEMAKQSREDDMHQRMLDMAELRRLLANPPEAYAKRQYGSVEAYKKMIQNKIDKMNKKEGLEDACWSGYTAIGTKEKNGKTVPNCVPESLDFARQVKMAGLITGERNKALLESFIMTHPITDRHLEFTEIRAEFNKFKKLHEAENILSNDKMEDLIDKIRLKISKVIDDEWHNTTIIHDWIKENPEKVSHYMSRKNWDSLASIAADEIATKWEEDPKGHYGKYLDHRQYLHPSGQTRRSSLYKSLPI